MPGTFVNVVRPAASSAAAISFSALFFAPVTGTSPTQPAPPTTRNALHARHPAREAVGAPARLGPWST